MTWYTWAWIAWLVYFCVVEGIAIVDKKDGDTLSEYVWAWFSIKGKGKHWRWRRIALLGFMAWLLVHFLTGGWA